ncbi:MAG: type I methionyl aminopeptidase [Saprospiraceae bacterium]|nr:type I methionyl aminopeptidase [Saprospiraceae bacterium]
MVLKSKEEIELLKISNQIVSKTLAFVGELIRPGITGIELDRKAEEFIKDNGGKPSFKGYQGFPSSLCISINEAVVHGIPSKYEIREKDIVSVDCGVFKNGFHGDSAYTFAVGDVNEIIMSLLRNTMKSLYLGIDKAIAGNRVGDISHAIQEYTELKHGYGVVRELVGHGVGRELHEKPEVPNFGKKGKGPVLFEGMTIAIEPMINLGSKNIVVLKDGWTVLTKDRKPSAHFEHSIVVGKEQAMILSDHDIIEESIKKNINLKKI